MQNLLNEEEFKINREYNPKEHFKLCCLICFCCQLIMLVLIFIFAVFSVEPLVITISFLIFPLIIISVLVFGKKALLYSTPKNVALGIFILLSIFYLPLGVIGVISGDNPLYCIATVAVFILIPLVILMMIHVNRQKHII